MSEILILARVRVQISDVSAMADYYFDVKRGLSEIEGFRGLSVWRDPEDTESYLAIYDYDGPEAADKGLMAVTESRKRLDSELTVLSPADVLRIRVEDRSTTSIYEAPATGCLSMSLRVAAPGYGPELVDDIQQTFGELQLMTGYCSSVIGVNEVLEEEVIGLIAWTGTDAFKSSLPPGKKVRQVQLYTRFF